MKTVAIIGCGRIARTHAANLAPHARLVLASRRRRSAEELRRRVGGETVSGLSEVLERADITGAVVCSPLEHHAGQAAALLAAGKTVLVEKPLAASPAEVERLRHLLEARRAGALMVAENYLYKPSLRLLRSRLPRIGKIRRVRLVKKTLQRVSGWRRDHGSLLEGGIHFVALLGAILEEPPHTVAASFPGGRSPERHAEIEVRYPSGAVGEVHYAWDRGSLPGGVFQHSTVEGKRGRIVFESNGLYLLERCGRAYTARVGPFADLMGFRAMTRDFLRTLADPDHLPRSDFARARRDLGVVFRAYGALPEA